MRIQMRANAEEEAREFAPLPEGDYVLTCTGVQDKTTKTGKNMAVLELTVTEGPCVNRKVWHNVIFIPEGEKGHRDRRAKNLWPLYRSDMDKKIAAILEMGPEVLLTIYLKDGRELSGIYPPLCALARIEAARKFPLYADYKIEVPPGDRGEICLSNQL